MFQDELIDIDIGVLYQVLILVFVKVFGHPFVRTYRLLLCLQKHLQIVFDLLQKRVYLLNIGAKFNN